MWDALLKRYGYQEVTDMLALMHSASIIRRAVRSMRQRKWTRKLAKIDPEMVEKVERLRKIQVHLSSIFHSECRGYLLPSPSPRWSNDSVKSRSVNISRIFFHPRCYHWNKMPPLSPLVDPRAMVTLMLFVVSQTSYARSGVKKPTTVCFGMSPFI